MENWKEIIGYENEYQVSDLGNVRSVDRQVNDNGGIRITGGTMLKGEIVKGYRRVSLCRKSKKYRTTVHRLVAMHFLENKLNKVAVNHKDGNKLNNCVDNLEWCTNSENIRHAFKLGLKKANNPMVGRFGAQNSKSIPIVQMSLNDEIIKIFPCAMEVKRQLKFVPSYISKCANRGGKIAYGFKWRRITNIEVE